LSQRGTKAAIKARETCKCCHGTTYDVDKIMPGPAWTAAKRFVRSHTFNKNQDRMGGPTVSGKPVHYFSTPGQCDRRVVSFPSGRCVREANE
jgi:hypothetical protein